MQYVKLPLLPKSEMRHQIASDERARYNCFFSCKNLNAVLTFLYGIVII